MPRRFFLKRVAEIAGSATAAAAILPIQRDAEPLGIKNVIEAQYDRDGLERMGPLRTLLERGIPFHIEGAKPRDDRNYPTWYMQRAVTRLSDDGSVVGQARRWSQYSRTSFDWTFMKSLFCSPGLPNNMRNSSATILPVNDRRERSPSVARVPCLPALFPQD